MRNCEIELKTQSGGELSRGSIRKHFFWAHNLAFSSLYVILDGRPREVVEVELGAPKVAVYLHAVLSQRVQRGKLPFKHEVRV